MKRYSSYNFSENHFALISNYGQLFQITWRFIFSLSTMGEKEDNKHISIEFYLHHIPVTGTLLITM